MFSTTYAFEVPPETSIGTVLSVLARSPYLSTTTFATLGYGDVQPVGYASRTLAGIESLLGALLLALLISVLARRAVWL